MDNKISKLSIVFIILALFSGITMATVQAQEAPPGVPDDPFGGDNSGGGGGGGSGGSYNPPVFASYTHPIKSSDGTEIGYFNGKNYNSVLVWAEKNGTAGSATYVLTVEGELGSEPSGDCWLDINFLSDGSAAVPPGMESGLVLGVLNVNKSPTDWGYKSGPMYTLKIAGVSVNPDNTYYMVRSAGPDYQLQKLSMSVSGNETTIKFNPQGDTGTFTVIRAPMATPTPTPTPTPEPTATPTPIPENNMWSFPILIAMFAVGAIAGAAVLYILNIRR